MNLHQIDFEATGRFSSTFLDYIQNKETLQPFFNQPPNIKSFEKIIAQRNFDDARRPALIQALNHQYEGIKISSEVSANIYALADKNTFTITTGHQLNIFTGPLFFIYKIIAAINLAKKLKERFPDSTFVPVYWMASEDHDFAEINHFRLFGSTYTWQHDASGPVGKLSTASMKDLLNDIPELPKFITDAYLNSRNLADATIRIVNELFGKYGLVILDADYPQLKKQFSPIIKDDVFNNHANQLAENSTQALEKAGYKGQIFPREINFFYMENGTRERIIKEGAHYKVLNTDLSFTEQELENLVETHPERFSPNVVMRPVYQEVILPNLAYIGGPAEMAYWLQLKGVFDHYEVPFPVLFPRLFGMIIPWPVLKKMDKNALEIRDIFQDMSTLKQRIISSENDAHLDLSDELKGIQKVFLSIREKAGMADKSLEGFVMAEEKKAEKSIDNIQKRIKKAEEQKHEVSINQVQGVLDKLFPNGHLQEREDNFLNFYINNPEFIEELAEKLDPLSLKFNILTDDA
jgi:bacillithiol biosynthesis cysteine-adding enzyme BshC